MFRLYTYSTRGTKLGFCGHKVIEFIVYTHVFRLYSTRLLPLQVVGTWIGGFGSLIPTLASAWGQFGMDPEIGSCSILPDRYTTIEDNSEE